MRQTVKRVSNIQLVNVNYMDLVEETARAYMMGAYERAGFGFVALEGVVDPRLYDLGAH